MCVGGRLAPDSVCRKCGDPGFADGQRCTVRDTSGTSKSGTCRGTTCCTTCWDYTGECLTPEKQSQVDRCGKNGASCMPSDTGMCYGMQYNCAPFEIACAKFVDCAAGGGMGAWCCPQGQSSVDSRCHRYGSY
jgi:hypothetical protein